MFAIGIPHPADRFSCHKCAQPLAWLAVAVLATAVGMPAAVAQDDKKADDSKVEEVELPTADGMRLAVTFYPGKNKESVPVVLLHMHKGSRSEYNELAPYLQKLGHAVLVPDLRGHGGSTERKGSKIPLKAATMSRTEFTRMVEVDMPTLKAYLMAKNNAGELNIEKLCVVGAEMGASVALNWARIDWNMPPVGNKKNGQDIKAVVAISPEWSTPGIPLQTAMGSRNLTTRAWDPQLQLVFKNPDELNFNLPVTFDWRKEVSVLIAVGSGKSKAVGDAKRLNTMLKSFHPDLPPDRRKEKDLYYEEFNTSLEGTKMLGKGLVSKRLTLEAWIAGFIKARVEKRAFPWSERRDPYAGR
ncbi:MAG: alpha/beta fold hydrolase [Candidatus Nealsonbacteria bacterium]|nr:alpha/beta fold hydrolase [Candidatus Nealsonbacteria bacterium]